jgi:hypothetical protein
MKRLIALTTIALLSFACDDSPETSQDSVTSQPPPTTTGDDTAGQQLDDGTMRTGTATTVTARPAGADEDPGGLIEEDEDVKCDPITCEDKGFNCGMTDNGCEETIDCGTCAEGELCGFEQPNVCAAPPACVGASSCAELGYECGIAIDDCGNTFDCAAEGIACNDVEVCVDGEDGKTVCEAGIGGEDGCDVCDGLADCDDATPTILTGRVITAGRADDDAANQVGVPNAFVYILTNNDPAFLPEFVDGIPEGETACDRCDGQDLGPVLAGGTTDALGYFQVEGNVPVGVEFILVTKVGRFRRGVQVVIPETGACGVNEVPITDTRLPRSMTDGLGVNIPKTAIATGNIDAMECVFEKMGIDHGEFSVGDAANAQRIHLYGTDGAEMPEGNPPETDLTGDSARMTQYDMMVMDCRGANYLNPPADAGLDNVRDYVNRGGRMFASHLSYQWICRNGEDPYDEATATETGLRPSAEYENCEQSPNPGPDDEEGMGIVSIGRPGANPEKIDAFAEWLENEGAAINTNGQYEFDILEPRDLTTAVGESSEEFVFRGDIDTDSVQQYSFNTPYGSPPEAACGRVAYSGFHVSAAGPDEPPAMDADAGAGGGMLGGGGFGGGVGNQPFANAVFPEHCEGDLTPQEKVLLWMLFDLGACVGDPPDPPVCEPTTCEAVEAECGIINAGCGTTVDCGPCPPGEVCHLVERNKCAACEPKTCDEVEIECGVTGDGCGGTITCECPEGESCGLLGPNKCGDPDIAE